MHLLAKLEDTALVIAFIGTLIVTIVFMSIAGGTLIMAGLGFIVAGPATHPDLTVTFRFLTTGLVSATITGLLIWLFESKVRHLI